MSSRSQVYLLRRNIGLAVGMFFLITTLFAWYVEDERLLEDAHTTRFVSSIGLARELRQSSDDLTRMVRSYVMTGDALYKQHFQEILDIRNGLKPLPEDYQNIYWDLVDHTDARPRGNSVQTGSLLERMKQAGITEQEFALLAEAKKNSDDLTRTEFTAMQMVEKSPAPDDALRYRAALLLTDAAYHKAKAAIMRPIAQFTEQVLKRTDGEIRHLQNATRMIRFSFLILGVLMLWTLWSIYQTMQQTLGTSLNQLHRRIVNLGSGKFDTPIVVEPGMENSILGWLSQMQVNLAQLDAARRDAEERLEITKQRMVNIIHATQVGTWERNMQTGSMLVNERWASMLGYTLAELEPISSYTFQRLVHPDDLEQAEILKQMHFENKVSVYECKLRMQHKDGHWVWILTRGSLLSRTDAGDPEWMAGSHLDISDLEEANTQLRDNEQQMRVMLNEMPVGVCLVDSEGRIFFRNRYMVDLLGYNDVTVPNLDSWWEVAYPEPEYRAKVMRAWKKAIDEAFRSNKPILPNTYTVQAADGRKLEVEIAGITTSFGVLATFIDQTENRRVHQQLEEAKTMAEAASQAKSAFLAAMSHEIRTPMSGMLGMIRLLAQTELTAQQLDYARKAEGATRALLGIINDILDFSKIEAGKFELDNIEFVLSDLLRDLSTVLSANLSNKRVEVLFSLDPQIPPVLVGDPMRLRQILLNLAGNAIKFTEKGDVVLSITLTGSHVGPNGQSEVTLEFAVQDSGIGIQADKLQHIFDSFSQAESSIARRYGGTGLGLSISKQLLTMMGGDLQVSSTYGKGSRFYFTLTLPVAQPLLNTEPETDPASEALRLLIVDDNQTSCEILAAMADSLGWSSVSVHSGEQALDLLQQPDQPQFDVILMDWRLPGMDGWQTIQKIREPGCASNNSLIVMITAHGLELFNQKSRETGTPAVDGYLFKPITPDMLTEAVSNARRSQHRLSSRSVGSQRLAGKRILVVEDNRLNQQIAREMLQLHGATVEIAGNGSDGVQMALKLKPSAILMDMQMPDIDGLEATRRIRQHPEMLSTPIIAMTANAMEADRQACLAAGMVEHIPKPIDLEKLIRAILIHTAGKTKPDPDQTPPPAAAAPSATQHDHLVDWRQAVSRLGGNSAFYEKLIVSFCNDGHAKLQELRQCVDNHQFKEAAIALHTFKGLAATVGADTLAQVAAGLEPLLRQEGPDSQQRELHERLENLEALSGQVVAELRELDTGISRVSITLQDGALGESGQRNARLQEELQTLMDNLKSNNMRSVALCSQIRQEHSGWLSIREMDLLLGINDNINQLNFNHALSLCNQLLELIE